MQVGERKRRAMVVFGTRPEAIKMLPVVRKLRSHPSFETVVVVTAQHRELLDQVLQLFGETPDVDLDLMTPGQSLATLTSRVLTSMSDLIRTARPDLVLVHGDTTTAMASAMAAFYEGIPIGHVEAGLRSNDLGRPWPEEFNRVTIDSISALRFAPTATAAMNLDREYSNGAHTVVTGNTGIDALLYISDRLDAEPALRHAFDARHGDKSSDRHLVLVTAHRRESFGEGFRAICAALLRLASRPDVDIVYPVHPNPNVRATVMQLLSAHPRIRLVDPVGYAEMVYLMKRATILLTDSGGLQEEGPALGKPVLVLRDVTERPEAVATGVVELVGTNPAKIASRVERLLDDPVAYAACARVAFPYGNGTAAKAIVDAIESSDLT